MAKEFYGYYDSILGDVRSYDAAEFSNLLLAGTQSGITSHSGGGMQVSAGGDMKTTVSYGGIMINGYLYVLSDDGGEPLTLAHSVAGSAPRIDRVVARLVMDGEVRRIAIAVLEGTPAAAPVAPALTRTAKVYEMSLAQVRVNASAAAITEDDITDERGDESVCGEAVPVWLNKSKLNASYAHSAITDVQINAILEG